MFDIRNAQLYSVSYYGGPIRRTWLRRIWVVNSGER
jgi:hypothetical protein